MHYESEMGEPFSENSDKYAVYLGAYAMACGVKIREHDMEVLRSALKRLEMRLGPKRRWRKPWTITRAMEAHGTLLAVI